MKEHAEALWGRLSPDTQRQVRKAGMAAAIAFVTVFAAPLINPLHPSHRHTGNHAAREGERRGGAHGRGGHGRS